jgi:hypothetical protein
MASELIAPMAVLELANGTRLVLEARDAATGAEVAGVVVNNFVIYGRDLRDDNPGELAVAPVFLTPTDVEGRNPADFGGPGG